MEKSIEALRIIKILNNSALLVNDTKQSFILLGKGIAFNRKADEILSVGFNYEQRFGLLRSSRSFEQLISQHKPEIIDLVFKTVQEFMFDENQITAESLVAFCDHIATMYDRVVNHESIENPFLMETKTLYPESFKSATLLIDRVNKKYTVEIPEAEIGFIALHLQKISSKDKSINVNVMNNIIFTVTNLLTEKYNYTLDKESIKFAQFITHIKFVVLRLVRKESSNNEMTEIILNKYSKFKPLAIEIVKIIEKETLSELNIDELAYLMMHVSRLN
jgi:transcriptional antiterminator